MIVVDAHRSIDICYLSVHSGKGTFLMIYNTDKESNGLIKEVAVTSRNLR